MATVLITSEFFGKFSDEGIKVLTDAGPYGKGSVRTQVFVA